MSKVSLVTMENGTPEALSIVLARGSNKKNNKINSNNKNNKKKRSKVGHIRKVIGQTMANIQRLDIDSC